jgi:hypothetical protein
MYFFAIPTPHKTLKHRGTVRYRFLVYKFRGKEWGGSGFFMDRDQAMQALAEWEATGGDVTLVEITEAMVTYKGQRKEITSIAE